ncbi:MAG: gluconate 2-dehydrogenase subunit 3 family protein [Terriglobia bacterium]
MDDQVISRRNTLKYLSLLAGTEAGSAFLSEWLPAGTKLLAAPGARPGEEMGRAPAAGSTNQPAAYQPRFFKPEEFETVEILTEMIIPADEKPGAREAHVASYIDFVTASAAEFKPELQAEWIEGLKSLEDLSREKYGHTFRDLSAGEREALLTEMSLPERAPEAGHPGFVFHASRPHLDHATTLDLPANHPGYSFYRLVKEMTVEGFYSSRTGLLDVLEYKGLTYLSSFPGCTDPQIMKAVTESSEGRKA